MSFWPRKVAHGLEQFAELVGSLGDDVLVGALGVESPVPGVVKGGDLGGGVLAGAFFEQDVVGGVGVERRVEVDEVDRLVRDVLAEDGEVIAEVELVGPGGHLGASGGRVGYRVGSEPLSAARGSLPKEGALRNRAGLIQARAGWALGAAFAHQFGEGRVQP